MTTSGSARTYGGKTADQRRDERRAAFVAAARRIWIEQGWAAVTMRGVCAEAALSDRYFYESFADRDVLLLAVAEETRDEIMRLLYASLVPHLADSPFVQLRAALGEIVRIILEDPGSAQVMFGDHGGSAALVGFRHESIRAFVDVMVELARPYLREGADDAALRVSTLVGIGGFVETVNAWQAGMLEVSAGDLVEMLQGVGEALGRRFTDGG